MKSRKGLWTAVILIALVVAVVATMAVRYIMSLNKEVIDDRPAVLAECPENRNIEVYTEQIGTVMPAEYVSVIPMLSGEILEVKFNVGDKVNKDDVLCVVNSDALDSLKLQLDGAKIQLDDATTTLERMKALFASGAISQQNLEQAESGAKAAQIQYDSMLNQYELQEKYSNIKAPISGVIESKNAEVHGFTSPQAPIAVISAEGVTEISFGISEESAQVLKTGEKVTVIAAGKEYEAKVTEIGTMISASGLHQVKASIEKGDDLTTGSRAKVELIKNRAVGVMSVPMNAVSYSGNKAFVYLLNDTKAVKQYVSLGINDGEYIEVTEGLAPTDKVITTWNKELYDGTEIVLE